MKNVQRPKRSFALRASVFAAAFVGVAAAQAADRTVLIENFTADW